MIVETSFAEKPCEECGKQLLGMVVIQFSIEAKPHIICSSCSKLLAYKIGVIHFDRKLND